GASCQIPIGNYLSLRTDHAKITLLFFAIMDKQIISTQRVGVNKGPLLFPRLYIQYFSIISIHEVRNTMTLLRIRIPRTAAARQQSFKELRSAPFRSCLP